MIRYDTLIDPLSLEKLLQQDIVRLLDCRAVLGDTEAGRRRFEAGHIPGARHLDLDRDLAAAPGEGGRHPLPDPEQLAFKLRSLGINDADQVVVYDDAGGAFAGRAWWCLRWLGHEAVALLDGGLAGWCGELTEETRAVVPGNFSIRPSLTRTVDAATLLSRGEDFQLTDARSEARFSGTEEPVDPVAGHIPGARCLPFQGNLDSSGRFLSADLLRERFADLVEPVVCYCGSGVTAAHNVLAMRIAGYPEPFLYPGSWSEWIRDPSRPRIPATPVASTPQPAGRP
ncbi:MAG: sulfurtransferase [Pseudomonadales bacterium]